MTGYGVELVNNQVRADARRDLADGICPRSTAVAMRIWLSPVYWQISRNSAPMSGPDSLLGLAYTGRQDRLEALGLDADPVRTPPWYRDDAEMVLATGLRHGLEGVVGKPLASRYHPGGHRGWIKVKNIRHQEVIIGGWNHGEGGRAHTIGSLLLGCL